MFHNITDPQQTMIALAGFAPTSSCAPEDLAVMAAMGREEFAEARDALVDLPTYIGQREDAEDKLRDARNELFELKERMEAQERQLQAFMEERYPEAFTAWIEYLGDAVARVATGKAPARKKRAGRKDG